MGLIYKISNDINDKIYIGKTFLTLQQRFNEHCKDSKGFRMNRPLYKAMNKYGIEHFKIELVEEVLDWTRVDEREIYWIDYYDSYNNGYNATLGGDGKVLIDYQNVFNLFQEGASVKEIAEELERDTGHIADILKSMGISQEEILNRKMKNQCKSLQMLDKNEQVIMEFISVAAAAQYCIDNNLSKDTISGISAHISQCCNGIRNTAYKYKWKYIGVVQRLGL